MKKRKFYQGNMGKKSPMVARGKELRHLRLFFSRKKNIDLTRGEEGVVHPFKKEEVQKKVVGN